MPDETATTVPTLKFAEWKGEPPAIKGRKVRPPNPYDELVKKSFDSGKSFSGTVPAVDGVDLSDAVKGQVRLLRNAARFLDVGVDIRILDGGVIWFQGRAKRERNTTPETAPAAA
jgi:hypothetical protein